MRHRRCRRVGLSTFHGFALWASPAVTHGVSPLGTVDEHVEAFRQPPSLHIAYSFVDALIHYFACLCSCISCIVCRPSHHLFSSAASTQRYSRLRRRRTAGIEQPHKSTLASGGGAPCLTAGDARRVNPWKEDRENSDASGVALQAWREHHSLSLRNTQTRRAHFPHTFPSLGVVSSATISAPADAISLSAHTLIVFSNTIRISTLTFLISTHLLQKKLKKSSEDSEDFQHN